MPTTASTAATPPAPAPPTPRADTGLWQALVLIVIASVVVTNRVSGARKRRIQALRDEIERRSEVIRSHAPGTDTYRLYVEETDAMAREIRALKGSDAGLPRWGVIVAVVAVVAILGFVTGTL